MSHLNHKARAGLEPASHCTLGKTCNENDSDKFRRYLVNFSIFFSNMPIDKAKGSSYWLFYDWDKSFCLLAHMESRLTIFVFDSIVNQGHWPTFLYDKWTQFQFWPTFCNGHLFHNEDCESFVKISYILQIALWSGN